MQRKHPPHHQTTSSSLNCWWRHDGAMLSSSLCHYTYHLSVAAGCLNHVYMPKCRALWLADQIFVFIFSWTGVPNEVANAAYFIAEDCCCMWFIILAVLCTFSCFTLMYVVTPQQPFFERRSIWVTVAVSSCFRGSKAARMLRLPTLITTLRLF